VHNLAQHDVLSGALNRASLVHDNAAVEPPARPEMPQPGFNSLPTMPAPL
jgi:hypothetical protein